MTTFLILLATHVAVFATGYFVGSKNPAKQVAQNALESVDKLVKKNAKK